MFEINDLRIMAVVIKIDRVMEENVPIRSGVRRERITIKSRCSSSEFVQTHGDNGQMEIGGKLDKRRIEAKEWFHL